MDYSLKMGIVVQYINETPDRLSWLLRSELSHIFKKLDCRKFSWDDVGQYGSREHLMDLVTDCESLLNEIDIIHKIIVYNIYYFYRGSAQEAVMAASLELLKRGKDGLPFNPRMVQDFVCAPPQHKPISINLRKNISRIKAFPLRTDGGMSKAQAELRPYVLREKNGIRKFDHILNKEFYETNAQQILGFLEDLLIKTYSPLDRDLVKGDVDFIKKQVQLQLAEERARFLERQEEFCERRKILKNFCRKS